MEQTQETGKGIIQFDFVNNPEHVQLLGLVTLDASKLENPGWLAYMQACFKIGGTEQRTAATSIKTSQKIEEARRRSELEIGILSSEHPLHSAYKSRASNEPLIPASFLSTVAVVQNITGDAISAIRLANNIIRAHPATLQFRYNFIDRSTQLFGWQGDTQELVRRHPALLSKSVGYLALLARIIERYGSTEYLDASADTLARATRCPAEGHLLAAMTRPSYAIGDRLPWGNILKHGAPKVREHIHTSLTQDLVLEKLGRKMVTAYLRVHPLPNPGIVDEYPNLRAYVPKKSLPVGEKDRCPEPLITGDEEWLLDIPLSALADKRRRALDKINHLLRVGSRSISGQGTDNPLYNETLDARLAVFELFGLSDPDSSSYAKFDRYFSRLKTLPSSMHIIHACNTLEAHGVTNGIELIGKCFEILHVKNETLDAILREIEDAGLSPRDILEKNVSLLVSPPARRATSLAHHMKRDF